MTHSVYGGATELGVIVKKDRDYWRMSPRQRQEYAKKLQQDAAWGSIYRPILNRIKRGETWRTIVSEMSYAGIGAYATSFGKTIEPIRPLIERYIEDLSAWTLSEEKGRTSEWSVGMLMFDVFNLDHHLGINLLRCGMSDEELAKCEVELPRHGDLRPITEWIEDDPEYSAKMFRDEIHLVIELDRVKLLERLREMNLL